MKVFVIGATGFQGANIAQQLLNDNHQVVTLKRDATKGMPAAPGIQVVNGGLENRESLETAMKDVQSAVFSFPLIFDMAQAKEYTENFIAAAKKENVQHIVFNATFHLAAKETGFLALDLKVMIKELFDESGLNVTTLVPDIYLDNISAPWSIPVMMEHKIVPYPIAADKKLPWISHKDLGKYVAKAIAKPELAGEILNIGGNLVSGKEIASAISSNISQELQFVEVKTDEFEQQLTPGFGPLAAQEISNLYRFIEQNHDAFVNKDYERANQLLGMSPQSLTEWANNVNWSQS